MCMGYAKGHCGMGLSGGSKPTRRCGETWVELGMEMVALMIDPSVGGPQQDPQ